MSRSKKDLRWTPVHNGKYYCSPGCGGSKYCKLTWYKQAQAKAKKLANMLPGFKTHLFENLGWYWYASNKKISIRPAHYDPQAKKWGSSFYAFYANLGFLAEGKTPKAALQNMLTHMENKQNEYRDHANHITAVLKGFKL